jgi:tRNA dimethylallyltransferase
LHWLQQEVERLDPEYYAKVDRKNPIRLKRALEIIYTTGKKYSEQRIGKKNRTPISHHQNWPSIASRTSL